MAHTRLSWRYVREHARLLDGDPRLELAATRAPDDYGAGTDMALRQSRYPVVPLLSAISRAWDVALFGTHGSDLFFGRTAARVHIQHGVGAGKQVHGQDFTYGARWSLWRGRPKYDAMLEASHAVRARAVAACPQLEPVIRVVGDLCADRLLASMPFRDSYRRALGIAPNQTAVLFISSWGHASLMARSGVELLSAALRMGSTRRVMLTMHPHLWAGAADQQGYWYRRLSPYVRAGLVVCGPDDDWVPYLVAADVAVIDHGSLGVYWSLLARPTLRVPTPGHLTAPASPIAALHNSVPALTEPDRLDEAVEKAMAIWECGNHHMDPEKILCYQGQAAERSREVLYELLKLDPPQSPTSVQPAEAPWPWLVNTDSATPDPER